MSFQELFDSVVQILKGPCGVKNPIRAESRLMEDLHLDSMGMLALAVGLENRYRLKLAEDPEHPPETVADVVKLLAQRLEEAKHE